MAKEYRAKVFKSGNSVALRLPKALGLKEGQEMIVREERGKFAVEPVEAAPKKIDLSAVYGSIPGLKRPAFEHLERSWPEAPRED